MNNNVLDDLTQTLQALAKADRHNLINALIYKGDSSYCEIRMDLMEEIADKFGFKKLIADILAISESDNAYIRKKREAWQALLDATDGTPEEFLKCWSVYTEGT